MRTRLGHTLLELVIVLAMLSLLFGIVGLPAAAALDRAAVRSAADDLTTVFAQARREALARHQLVWVVLDTVGQRALLRIPQAGTRARSLGSLYRVVLRCTRDSMAYDARGLGHGGANLTVEIRRGQARRSLVISRLGRVRQE